MPARTASTVGNARTTTGTKIIVVFCCAKCDAAYKAVQHRQWTERGKVFKCPVCELEVYSWRGIIILIGQASIQSLYGARKVNPRTKHIITVLRKTVPFEKVSITRYSVSSAP